METLASLPAVGEALGIGMPAAIELVEDKGSRKPALGLGAKVVAEAGKRGLIMRQRGGADGPPASGDPLCLAPPLMTPAATLDRIVRIVGGFHRGGVSLRQGNRRRGDPAHREKKLSMTPS